MRRKANVGNIDGQLQALTELPANEQKEVKVGVLSEIVNKVKVQMQSHIDAGALDTFKDLIKETGLANKIRRGEKIITAPSNPLEKKISEKAKSFADTVGTYADTAANLSKKIPQATMEGLGAAKGVLTRPGQTAGGRKKITQKTKKSKKSQKE